MLTLCLLGCYINAENWYRTHSLHLHLCQIVYGNTMLQFVANANVDASVNEALAIIAQHCQLCIISEKLE